MPASTAMPELTVAVAFTTQPSSATPAWQDVTDYLEAQLGITIDRGRGDELSQIQASTLGLTFDDRDGRFTPGRVLSPYYPNVKKSNRIRVSARWPLNQPGNFVANSTFEINATGWVPFGVGTGSIARSTTRAQQGTASGLITWATAASGSAIGTTVSLVIGKTYTASAYVWVPTGNPDVRLGNEATNGTSSAVKDAWVRISVTFVATQASHVVGVKATSATTAGQTCFVDAMQVDEGSSVVTFTPDPPPIFHRCGAYVDEWPVEWQDGTDAVAVSRVTATSRQARMGRGAELRSVVEMEVLQDGPAAYFPLGEPEGSSRAGNVAATPQPQMEVKIAGSGGSISFGTATGPGTDGLTAALFTRSSPTGGSYLVSSSPTPMVSGTGDGCTLLEVWFLTNLTAEMGIAQADQFTYYPGQVALFLGTNSSGKLIGVNYGVGGPVYTAVSAATVSDGLQHHAALRETVVGSTITADLFLDGILVDTEVVGGFAMTVHRLMGGGGLVNGAYAGTLAHPAVTWSPTQIPDDRVLQHFLAGSTGFSGERSDQRIQRLARYAGIAAAEVSVETGLSTSIVNQETGGRTPIDLMQEVVATENGLLFDAGDGRLVFQARSHRYNRPTTLTLNATLQEIEGGLKPKLDDQGMANDVTASRPGGVAIRAVDRSSIDEYNVYRTDLPLLTTSDTEVEAAAYWAIGTRAQPGVRIPAAKVDLFNASSAQKTLLLSIEIGDRITLAGLPAQAPSSSLDFFIEGISEEIGDEKWTITFNLSPAANSAVWQLDSPMYSQLGVSTRLAY